ncbi:hypothetical protein [Pseudomonas aeruginosa]|uniref:hypothetical protein n=1 Tax=Pseudomonas aeruginosa TaxID=287 RepID=UPI00210EE02C|nr:hypothetical protein [Pseudomonas aeruginosa]MCW8021899.1 hypothetical protein [Pseudomonas aeruginosa]
MSKELNKATVEQAGGDERAAFEYWASDEGLYPKAVERAGNCYKLAQTQSYWMAWQARAALAQPSPTHAEQAEGAQEVPSPVSQEYDRHLISLLRKGEALPGHQEEAADEIERLRDWNDHLNNTVLPNILNPNFLMLMKGGERLLDLCTKDGKFIGVSLNDMKDVFDWMVTHARIAPDHAALAQHSPAQAEQAEAERPEQPKRHTADVFYHNHFSTVQMEVVRASDFDEFAAQHERISAQLHDALDESDGDRWKLRSERDAANARLHEVATACATAEQERDAALAEVERLRESKGDPVGSLEKCMKVMYERDEHAKRLEVALARVAEMEKELAMARDAAAKGDAARHAAGGMEMEIQELREKVTELRKELRSRWTYASTQATNCAGCGEHKHTPLRVDWMGGYVCLTCIDKKLEELHDAQAQHSVPDGASDLCRFLAKLYCELDGLRYSTAKLPAEQIADALIFKCPVLQGARNQLNIKRISEQPYDESKLHSAIAAMLAAAPGKEGNDD